jgi:glycyl-tRNA synthetase beta chain
VRLLARTDAVSLFIATDDGLNLLAAFRRVANILRIEEKKDGGGWAFSAEEFAQGEEADLFTMLGHSRVEVKRKLAEGDGARSSLAMANGYSLAMTELAKFRRPLDAFFDKVTVNAAEPELRRNRLALLSQVRDVMNQVADFSRIEG